MEKINLPELNYLTKSYSDVIYHIFSEAIFCIQLKNKSENLHQYLEGLFFNEKVDLVHLSVESHVIDQKYILPLHNLTINNQTIKPNIRIEKTIEDKMVKYLVKIDFDSFNQSYAKFL